MKWTGCRLVAGFISKSLPLLAMCHRQPTHILGKHTGIWGCRLRLSLRTGLLATIPTPMKLLIRSAQYEQNRN